MLEPTVINSESIETYHKRPFCALSVMIFHSTSPTLPCRKVSISNTTLFSARDRFPSLRVRPTCAVAPATRGAATPHAR